MKRKLDYVSVVGFHLIQPLLDLVAKLEHLPAAEPNEVQAAPAENGYSCVVIVLTAVLLESALNRTRYVREDADATIHVANYFRKISPDQDLAHDVNEIFAIRDAIVHNHLWKAEINPVTMKFRSPPKRLPGYGGKRFEAVMDAKTRLSSRLKLNLFPSRISRRDAYIVFKTAVRTLEQLEKMDRRYFYVGPRPFNFHGLLVRLPEVLNCISSLDV